MDPTMHKRYFERILTNQDGAAGHVGEEDMSRTKPWKSRNEAVEPQKRVCVCVFFLGGEIGSICEAKDFFKSS